MPTMFGESTFGPYLCAEHVQRVNADRDDLRSRVPVGWVLTEEPGDPALRLKRKDGRGDNVVWDPLGGVAVDDFLAGLQ
jgi:hypothetical protein